MAGSNDYTLKWELDASKFLSESAKIEAALKRLDALADQVNGKLNKLGSGASRPLGNVARAAARVGTALQATGQQAAAATTQMTGLGTAASQAGTSLKTVHGATVKVNKGLGTASGGADKLTAAFKRLVAQAVGMGAVVRVVGQIGDAIKDAREKAEGRGEKALGMRDDFRALANLMGAKDTDEAIAASFKLAKTSAYSVQGSRGFLEEYLGSVETAKELGNVRGDQIHAVGAASARSAYRLGIAPEVAGRLTGAMLQNFDVNAQVDANGNKLTPEQAVAGKWDAANYAIGDVGQGDPTILAQSLIAGSASSIPTGRVRDIEEMAAWTAVASTVSKKAGYTGTNYAQMEALLFRNDEKAKAYFRKIGADQETTTYGRAKALKADLDRVRAAGGDTNTYLTEQGFMSREERRSAIGIVGRLQMFEATNAEAHKRSAAGVAAVAKDEAFQGTRTAVASKRTTREEEAEHKQGLKMEPYMMALGNAKAQLLAEGKLDSTEAQIIDKLQGGFGVAEWFGDKSPLRKRAEAVMWRNAQAAAKKAGIDPVRSGWAEVFSERGILTPKGSLEEVLPKMEASGIPREALFGGTAADAAIDAVPGRVPANVPVNVPPPHAAGAGAGPQAATGVGGGRVSVDNSRLESLLQQLVGETSRQTAAIERGGRGGSRPLPEFEGPGPYRA